MRKNTYIKRIDQKLTDEEISECYEKYFEKKDKILEMVLKEISFICSKQNLTLDDKIREIHHKTKKVLPHTKNKRLSKRNFYVSLNGLARVCNKSPGFLKARCINKKIENYKQEGKKGTVLIPYPEALKVYENLHAPKKISKDFFNLVKNTNEYIKKEN